nr:glycine-rich cell wall structural protein 1.0-like [Aegilops tauschii subsp. strangulata]
MHSYTGTGDRAGEGGGCRGSGGHGHNGGARGGGGPGVRGGAPAVSETGAAASGAVTTPTEPAVEEATGEVEVEPVAGVAAPAGVAGGVPTGSTSCEGAGDPGARSDSTSGEGVENPGGGGRRRRAGGAAGGCRRASHQVGGGAGAGAEGAAAGGT